MDRKKAINTEISNIPKLRFPGYTESWEQRKLGELYSERNERGNDSLQILSVSIHTGVSDGELDSEKLGKTVRRSEDKTKYKHVSPGDLIFNMMRAWQGAIGVASKEGMVSPAYISAIPSEEVFPLFMDYTLRRTAAISQINNLSYGVTDFRKRLYWGSFTQVSCALPSVEEQQKIWILLNDVDNAITLYQRKYEKLKQVKQSMMVNMFPQNGETKPKLRFDCFSDDWEQRKVSDVSDRYDNLRVPVAANLRVKGSTPYYGANGIQDYVEGYTHDGEFILVAEDGANDIKNYPVNYVNGQVWVNNHAHVLQAKDHIADNRFLGYAISRADIESFLVGGGRAKLNAEVLMNISLQIPSKLEQIQIATLISSLDNLICLYQQKLDKLKNIKTAFLQKMFV